jgi:hypothetical protein
MEDVMSNDFSLDETRKLAVLMARAWADPQLAANYRANPEAVLSGAGIDLGGRAIPEIPERPSGVAKVDTAKVATDSASSLSTITCPCSACTASCHVVAPETLERQMAVLTKLAEDPTARQEARRMTSAWGVPAATR